MFYNNFLISNIKKENPATEAAGPCVNSEVGVRLPKNHIQKYKLSIQKKVQLNN